MYSNILYEQWHIIINFNSFFILLNYSEFQNVSVIH